MLAIGYKYKNYVGGGNNVERKINAMTFVELGSGMNFFAKSGKEIAYNSL